MEKMEEKESAAVATAEATAGGASLRWSVLNINAAADTPSLSPSLPGDDDVDDDCAAFCVGGERERERERKERNIDNGFWGRCPFSFRDRGSEGGINPMSSHDAAAHLCVRTSLLPLACSFSYAPRRPGTKMGIQTRCRAP